MKHIIRDTSFGGRNYLNDIEMHSTEIQTKRCT